MFAAQTTACHHLQQCPEVEGAAAFRCAIWTRSLKRSTFKHTVPDTQGEFPSQIRNPESTAIKQVIGKTGGSKAIFSLETD